MKKWKVLFVILLIIIFYLVFLNNYVEKQITDEDTENLNNPITSEDATYNIKNVISQYFDNYYKSFQILDIVNSDNIVEDNDNTFLAKATQNYMVEGYKVVGLYLREYKVILDYKTISVSGDQAKVDVHMHLDHVYSTPPDLKSALNDDYSIDLVLHNNQWKISGIDSTAIEFKNFKEWVDDKIRQGFSRRDAILKTEEECIQDLQNLIK